MISPGESWRSKWPALLTLLGSLSCDCCVCWVEYKRATCSPSSRSLPPISSSPSVRCRRMARVLPPLPGRESRSRRELAMHHTAAGSPWFSCPSSADSVGLGRRRGHLGLEAVGVGHSLLYSVPPPRGAGGGRLHIVRMRATSSPASRNCIRRPSAVRGTRRTARCGSGGDGVGFSFSPSVRRGLKRVHDSFPRGHRVIGRNGL